MLIKQFIFNLLLFVSGESCTIVTDFGGRVEELILMARDSGKLRNVLLTHDNNATSINENAWWKGMILLPWANRIAKVKLIQIIILFKYSFYI